MFASKPAPSNFPRISSAVFYDKPVEAIDWLCDAFGFVVRIKVVGPSQNGAAGELHHSELEFGESLIMVAQARDAFHSPKKFGGGTQSLCVYVDDVEQHYLHAKARGADIVSLPKDSDHGPGYWADRGYACRDPEGHHWWFVQRLRDNPPTAQA